MPVNNNTPNTSGAAPCVDVNNDIKLLNMQLKMLIDYCLLLEDEKMSLRYQVEELTKHPPCTLPHGMSNQEREMVERLEENMFQLETDLEQAEDKRLAQEMNLKLLHEENQVLKERCAKLEEGAANPPPCTLPHGMSNQERELVERLEENMLQLETDLEQAEDKRSVLERDLEQLQEHDMPQLLKENEGLQAERDSLKFQLDNAHNEICALTYAAPTPVSSPDLEGDDGMDDGNSQLAEIEELRFDCDGSQQRITTLEKQVYMLAEKLEQTCDQVNRVSQDTLRSHEQEEAIAPTTAELDHDKTCPQNKINNENTGLATPTASREFKILFNPCLSSSELLQSEVVAAPLAPPTPPPVRRWYNMSDALIYPRAMIATTQAAPKAPATNSMAAKTAKAIRKAAATAMAHIHFHHHH
ncbi:hypothetical protein IWW48_002418 [Coemansia sp. RSA 1200]|nr:hypothetical protein IWW48_002418 [Coemansia sp. RSA 1200]